MALGGRLIEPLLGRRRAQWFFERCVELGLRGMNLDAPSIGATNGERALIERLAVADSDRRPWTVIDVGANVGAWSATTADVLSHAGIEHVIWALEPSEAAFGRLVALASARPSIRPHRVGLGSSPGRATLHLDRPMSGLASLYPRRNVNLEREELVEITTLDRFRLDHAIGRIRLLKLDVEGHELEVLRGSAVALAEGVIDAVQFEFGGTHIDSRTFLGDISDALGPAFEIHRVLRDGLRPLGRLSERHEIFRLGNYVALQRVDI